LMLYAIQWRQHFCNEFFVWIQPKTCGKNDFFNLTKQKKLDSHQKHDNAPNTKTLYLVRYGKNNSLI
jgi:hypothetical protein